ncbi:MAG: ImmA/IrrE family metallo-endopeptidase [Lachnospiraceae bacterium]|nr:ImmA/IrrE family metallo-endopeptidase [Lachnospiraceae bacterium]
MSEKKQVELNDDQVKEIKRRASEARQRFGVHQNVPIGSDIRLVLEKEGILLCEYPFSDLEGTHTYGNITWFKTGEDTITFIGLNTSSYYDEQIFALAHEIYHFLTKTGKAYSKELDDEDPETEKKADRFAAEFLLPADALCDAVDSVFESSQISDTQEGKLLRFIARIQCEWWLPYRSIVNRLFEERYISQDQYDQLYDLDCRSEDGSYRRLLKSTDNEISELLNTRTKNIGVSNKITEVILSNYEDGFIDETELIEVLALFEKKPEDYGIIIGIDFDDDLAELLESEDDR